MNLFLLRHGLAVERGMAVFENDASRPLTSKGKRQLGKVAKAMRAIKLEFDLVWSSPLVRACQTAEIVAKELNIKRRLVLVAELSPRGSADRLIQKLRGLKKLPENVLLVGHEPDLSELISLLVTGETSAGFALKKAGLAKLEIENLRAGRCATLAWLLTPGQMKAMV
jgi:phosphohistidine phosphatase